MASMEPRPFERGNTGDGTEPGRVSGALQWSHVLSNVETSQSLAKTHPDTDSFNGATSFRTWKLRPLAMLPAGRRIASMEPRPFERGNHSPCGRSKRRG